MMKTIILTVVLWTAAFSQTYQIGEILSENDQNTVFDVCYGDYPESQFSFADLNGAVNGGNYYVTVVEMSATW